MKSFLRVIAEEYSNRYPDLSSLVFILPNKRSCSFLLKEIADLHDVPAVAPEVIPVTDFIARTCENVQDSRLDLIFRLYDIYRGLQKADSQMTFEKFSSWGETLLSDFNEIDMQMVDPEELFKNVYDLNAIKSSFLTANQKRVMVEYFGYSPEILEAELTRFWQKFEEGDGPKGSRKKFQTLWQLLLPLYTKLKESLHADGLTTTGGAYRETAEKVAAGTEPFEGRKLVFVGFNALSEAENSIFASLKEMEVRLDNREEAEPKADFIWDTAPEVFADNDGPALRFVSINTRKDRYPAPDWIRPAIRTTIPQQVPEIKVVAVPSNVMQAKVAGMELARMADPQAEENRGKTQEQLADEIKNARIAVVLPEENLLIPMLYSLPEAFSRPNLTMGFPLKHTPAISFASLMRKLHQGARTEADGSALFFFEDVKDFLGHPYAQMLFPKEDIDKFLKNFLTERRVMVSSGTLSSALGENAANVFRTFPASTPPTEVVAHILEIVSLIKVRMEEDSGSSFIRSKVERIYLGSYADALIRLYNCLEDYRLEIEAPEVFRLADRLIAGETVVFDGRPLEGLQIMGVLETRCLDFDKIIMPSVNEKVMPRVGRNSTFIPNIVRSAYGMPPANYQEELFAYYFYRVLGRCERAVLTFDSRSSSNRAPGPSRYILQMKYLADHLDLRETESRFNLPGLLTGEVEVEKGGDLEPYLGKYVGGAPDDKDKKRLSASALGNYFKCQLRFLFNNVLGLAEEREKTETIDAVDMGTIVHRAIEHLYMPADKRGRLLKHPLLIERDFLKGLLDEKPVRGETRIQKEAREAILKVHFHKKDSGLAKGRLRGSAAILHDYIVRYLRNIIETDLRQAPFRLWGTEIDRVLPYTLPDGRTVNLRMVIDRLDQRGAEGIDEPFRIVDYKTGSVHLEAEDFEKVFDGTLGAGNIFQLIFYSELLTLLARSKKSPLPNGTDPEKFEKNLEFVIYNVPLLPNQTGLVHAKIGKEPYSNDKMRWREVSTLGRLREIESEYGYTFMGRTEHTIAEILDLNTPFRGEPSEANCRICDFRLRCEVLRARKAESEEDALNAEDSGISPG